MSKRRSFDAIMEEIDGVLERIKEAVRESKSLEERVAEVCRELSSTFVDRDLCVDGVQLLLHEALEAKFREAGIDVEVAVFAGTPLSEFSEEELIAQTTLGNYPESAYDLRVALIGSVVRVRYFRASWGSSSEE